MKVTKSFSLSKEVIDKLISLANKNHIPSLSMMLEIIIKKYEE